MQRILTLLCTALLLILTTAASGTDLATLIQQLEDGDDFRVRVSAAMDLGKSKDSRARRPLERALEDSHASVRAAAAAGLKALADKRAIEALKRHRLDRSDAVRRQIKETIEALSAIPDPVVLVKLGQMTNGTSVNSPSAVEALRSASHRRLADYPEVALLDGEADSVQLPVVMLTGSIKKLAATRSGSDITYSAQVDYVLHRMPENSLAGRVTGSASAKASAAESRDRRKAAEIREAVLDAAVSSAMRQASRAMLTVAKR